MIEDNDTTLALDMRETEAQIFDHGIAYAQLDHRTGQPTPDRRDQRDGGDSHQDQTFGGCKQIAKSFFQRLHLRS